MLYTALQRLQQSIQLQLQQRIIARQSFLKSNAKKLEQTKITSGEQNWENKKTFGSWCLCFDCDKKICRECGHLRGRRAHNLRCGVSWGWGWSVRFFGLSTVGRKQLQDARKTIPSWFSDIVANNKTMVITNNNKPKQVSVWMIHGNLMNTVADRHFRNKDFACHADVPLLWLYTFIRLSRECSSVRLLDG